MKRSIISLCALIILAESIICNSVEEKRNTNLSQMYITARGDIQEIKINKNKIAINGNLKKQGEMSQFNLMLFPGDIISIKAKTGEGLKGGILGYINYVDEDKKTIKLPTNKEQWICDKAIPGEEKKKNSALIKEEGAQWIWGATYQQETICKVQIPCRGNEETKSNLRGEDKTKEEVIYKQFEKVEQKVKKHLKKKEQPVIDSTPTHHHSRPTHIEHAANKQLGIQFSCQANNNFIPYKKLDGRGHICLTDANSKTNKCPSFSSMEECLAYINDKAPKKTINYQFPI